MTNWYIGEPIELRVCPFCGSDYRNLCSSPNGFFVECANEDCNARTAYCESHDESIEEWNSDEGINESNEDVFYIGKQGDTK